MKNYELTCLISQEFSEEEIKDLLEKINNFISKNEGIIEKISNLIKKKLGYNIKNKNQVFLANINFQLNPDKLKEFEQKLKSENKILRHTIIIKQQRKEKKIKIKKESLEKSIENQIESIKPIISKSKPEKHQKIELKEIDKKIEEILNS
ncbi:MAG: 30S ribosomal protein S6 [Candidatus Nealsonbacteria bacterium]